MLDIAILIEFKKTTQQRCQDIDRRASLRISVGIDSNITGLSSYVYH